MTQDRILVSPASSACPKRGTSIPHFRPAEIPVTHRCAGTRLRLLLYLVDSPIQATQPSCQTCILHQPFHCEFKKFHLIPHPIPTKMPVFPHIPPKIFLQILSVADGS